MSVMAGCVVGGANSNILPKVERTMTPEASARLAELEAELEWSEV